MKSTMNFVRFGFFAITVCIFSGCKSPVYTVIPSFNPGVVQVPTLPCPVALRLSKEFTGYEHVIPYSFFMSSVETHVPFGPTLQKYAIYVAQSEFGDVQVLDSRPSRNDVKLVLIPRVTSSDLHLPSTGLYTSSGSLGVEWNFNDPKTGQTLFSIHVQSESTYTRSVFSQRVQAELSPVLDGLMTKLTSTTIQRFDASKDLRRLSGH